MQLVISRKVSGQIIRIEHGIWNRKSFLSTYLSKLCWFVIDLFDSNGNTIIGQEQNPHPSVMECDMLTIVHIPELGILIPRMQISNTLSIANLIETTSDNKVYPIRGDLWKEKL